MALARAATIHRTSRMPFRLGSEKRNREIARCWVGCRYPFTEAPKTESSRPSSAHPTASAFTSRVQEQERAALAGVRGEDLPDVLALSTVYAIGERG
jgi:hypothetical protein